VASRCVERRVVAGEWPLWHSASVWRGALLARGRRAAGRRPTPRESRPRLGRRCVAANWGIGERIHRLPIGLREAVCDDGRASHLYWAEQCEEKSPSSGFFLRVASRRSLCSCLRLLAAGDLSLRKKRGSGGLGRARR